MDRRNRQHSRSAAPSAGVQSQWTSRSLDVRRSPPSATSRLRLRLAVHRRAERSLTKTPSLREAERKGIFVNSSEILPSPPTSILGGASCRNGGPLRNEIPENWYE